jgi:hypothetical protein
MGGCGVGACCVYKIKRKKVVKRARSTLRVGWGGKGFRFGIQVQRRPSLYSFFFFFLVCL